MSLWDVLLITSFFSPFCGAVVQANYHHSGPLGYAVAAVFGIPLGIGFAWLMRSANTKLTEIARELSSRSKRQWLFRVLLAAELLWIGVGLSLGLILYPSVMGLST